MTDARARQTLDHRGKNFGNFSKILNLHLSDLAENCELFYTGCGCVGRHPPLAAVRLGMTFDEARDTEELKTAEQEPSRESLLNLDQALGQLGAFGSFRA